LKRANITGREIRIPSYFKRHHQGSGTKNGFHKAGPVGRRKQRQGKKMGKQHRVSTPRGKKKKVVTERGGVYF